MVSPTNVVLLHALRPGLVHVRTGKDRCFAGQRVVAGGHPDGLPLPRRGRDGGLQRGGVVGLAVAFRAEVAHGNGIRRGGERGGDVFQVDEVDDARGLGGDGLLETDDVTGGERPGLSFRSSS